MMLRELFSSMGFTLSVFAAVAVVFFYAVFLMCRATSSPACLGSA
jgi:hypothetical protein